MFEHIGKNDAVELAPGQHRCPVQMVQIRVHHARQAGCRHLTKGRIAFNAENISAGFRPSQTRAEFAIADALGGGSNG